jgi:hypothetical protein
MPVIESPAATDGTGQRVRTLSLGSPAVPSTTAVHAAVTDTGSTQTITTAITDPDVPRALTATAGGTAADIKAIQITVTGTNADGAVISETLPAFTVNTGGSVTGSKAFATVTSISIPAHDDTGATTAVGSADKLGIGVHLSRNTVLRTFLAGVLEGTAATVATSSTALESNTVDLNSATNGTVVLVDFYDS